MLFFSNYFQVHETDGFPQNICQNCKESVLKSYTFKVLCEKSQQFLHTHGIKTENYDYLRWSSVSEEEEEDYQLSSVGNNVRNVTSLLETPIKTSKSAFCHKCNKNFSSHSTLNRHMRQSKNHKVDKSDNPFVSETNQTIGPKNNTVESFVDINFDSFTQFDRSDNSSISELDFSKAYCDKCDKKFSSQSTLNRHLRQSKQHQLSIENDHQERNATQHKVTVKSNMQSNPPIKTPKFQPWACRYCSYVPPSRTLFHKHMVENHPDKRNFACPICGKTFFRKNNLTQHVIIHSSRKNHICDVCGASFYIRTNLTVHMRIHTGVKPYGCQFCSKRFAQHSAMKSHQLMHTDPATLKRDYVCDECGASFVRQGALYAHRKRHTGVRPFKCFYCDRRFFSGNERKAHLNTHTGVRDFTCGFCGKGFYRIWALKVHMAIHSVSKPHVCQLCGKGFNQTVSLRNHLKHRH